VLLLYGGFTIACVAAYLLAGLGTLDAVVIAAGTVSTGGFSGRPDSLAGFGAPVQIVATAGMLLAGAGVFVLWWIARGKLRPLARSQELRTYGALVVVSTVALWVGDGTGASDAVFMSASMLSTTGFASADFTTWGTLSAAVLLVGAGIGSMLGSAGGGMRVMRARLLLLTATAELRRQLEPRAVVIVRRDGRALPERSIDRMNSHQVAYVVLVGIGALMLGVAGAGTGASVWTSVSAFATVGPAVGEIGAFGRLGDTSGLLRVALLPLMLGGRMSIPVVLAGVGVLLGWQHGASRQLRLLAKRPLGRWQRSQP